MELERVEVWSTRLEKLTGFVTALLICVLRLRRLFSHVVEFLFYSLDIKAADEVETLELQ